MNRNSLLNPRHEAKQYLHQLQFKEVIFSLTLPGQESSVEFRGCLPVWVENEAQLGIYCVGQAVIHAMLAALLLAPQREWWVVKAIFECSLGKIWPWEYIKT